jgi:hypothetical protein
VKFLNKQLRKMLNRNQQDQIFYQNKLNNYEAELQKLQQTLELQNLQEIHKGELLHHHQLAIKFL